MKNIKQKIGLTCGVTGAVLVANGYTLEPNCIWIIGNLTMLSYFISIKEKELSLQMLLYSMIALYGILNLGVFK